MTRGCAFLTPNQKSLFFFQANRISWSSTSLGENHGRDAGQGQEREGPPEEDCRGLQEGRIGTPPRRKRQHHVHCWKEGHLA